MILSKYNIPSLNLSQYAIKSCMWEHFVDAACDSGKISPSPPALRGLLGCNYAPDCNVSLF